MGAMWRALLLAALLRPAATSNVTVHEYPLDSPVADIQWSGKEKTTVFVRTNKNSIYRSADEGRTWDKQNWKMEGSQSEEDGKSGVLSMHVSAGDTNKVFFRGASKQHWISTDEGAKYQPLPEAFSIKEVKMHPTEPGWMLASHLSDGCKKAERSDCQMEVHLTTDMGKSWKRISSYVAQFEWGASVEGVFKPGMHRETIFMVAYAQTSGNQPFGVWSAKANFMRSDDLWKTSYTLLPRGNRFLFLDKFLFVAVVNKMHENQVNLYVSSDGGKVFKRARLPFQLTEHSYTILDTSEGSVFLHVNHGDYNTGYGNIYLSDAEGLRFSLSLRNNKRDAQGRCDFEKLQGIEGIYIANEQKNTDADSKTKPQLRTRITFDKGGKWQFLKPPIATNTGKDFSCRADEDPGCSLHLHGVTDNWGPFYSSKNAIGLVMATGNVGHYLSEKEDEVHTFFSRDAGLSWQMVREGSHIYEYGDHGAIIVIADDRKASKSVFYSWDEAMTWNELHFSNEAAEIENIVIEPQATSQVFLMYGSRGDAGVLFQIDFSQLHEPQCKGVENAGDPGSDYELWSPYDGRQTGGKCLLGHQVRYTRRRRASQCYNGEVYERVEFRKNCPCAEEDYECDFGYERSSDAGSCVAIMSMSRSPPKECHGSYTLSNGYRLVAGDTCDPKSGVDHMPTVFRCPGFFSGSAEVSTSGWTILLVLLALLSVLGYVTLKNRGANLTLHDVLELIPREMPSFTWPPWGSSKGRYGRLPDTALDDEMDLGDEEEAEELHDGDMYAYENPNRPLGTLPVRTPESSAPKLPGPDSHAAKEGNLLGDLDDTPYKKGS
mmetsp:Transcript_24500/g.59046  ORF Transcript_24500/g.59046 Transcript_24500/m.59046 type:complete len:828 (+) Transcript_24500:5-2488(+)